MRKSWILTLIVMASVLVFSACTAAPAAPAADAPAADAPAADAPAADAVAARPASCDDENPYIAVALPNLTNPYYVAMQQGFQEAGEAAGYDVEVQIAGDDDAQQLAQVQAMLLKNPCALALNAVKSEPAAAIAQMANTAGVPVFTVNVTVSDEALTDQNATIMQYLGADNYAGGVQSAEMVLEDMGADAELQIGFVTEPDEVPVIVRDQGFEDTIAANPNASVVAKVDGNVKPDDSMQVTMEMLQGNPDLDVIFASTGPAAYGAIQALQSLGNTHVKVYGFCAAEEPLTEQYPGCVAQEPYDYGARVIGQIENWLAGGEVETEILRPLNVFRTGETPGPGDVG